MNSAYARETDAGNANTIIIFNRVIKININISKPNLVSIELRRNYFWELK